MRESQKRANKKWREKNLEKLKLYSKKWRENNRLRLAENTKKWIKNNPERHRENMKRYFQTPKGKEISFHSLRKHSLKTKYNLSVEEYNSMLIKQENKCLICKKEQLNRKLAVDHCHDTKKIRGLLCISCNLGLGYFKDNINLLNIAIKYLEEHSV